MDEQCDRWSYFFGFLMLKNYGIQDLQPKHPAYYESMVQKFYDAIMSDEELKDMLQVVFTTRSENYDPANFFRSPIQAGRGGGLVHDLQQALL